MNAPAHVVVDLGAVGRASVGLARWYRGLMATGEANVAELGRARAELAALPPQPGPLGRAVLLVASGGDGASDDEIMAAVALLCDAAKRAAATSAPSPPQTAGPRRRARAAKVTQQPPLPGLDEPGRPA